MKVVLYEWCASGGLHAPDAARILLETAAGAAGHPSAVMAEGLAMLTALAQDAAQDETLDVTLLIDDEVPPAVAARLASARGGARIRGVAAGAELDVIAAAASRADWTLVVAPETAGILADRVEAVRQAGGRPAACGRGFIDLAGDKQATAAALAAAGVPVPAGRPLDAGESMPEWFHLPAVRKARDGVGCEGLELIRTPEQARGAAPAPRRIEAFVPGMPVGVSCLCGPAGIWPLPPVRQRFAPGERPRYLGGDVVDAAGWRWRAEALAVRAIAAVARAAGTGRGGSGAAGWVGVDMILGAGEDGGGDRVLEVNPRLTTSFVGLAAWEHRSLLRLLLDAAAGGVPRPQARGGRTVAFDVDGTLRIHDG